MKLHKIGKITIDLDKLDFDGLKVYIKDLTEEKYFELTRRKVEKKVIQITDKRKRKNDFSEFSNQIHEGYIHKDS